MKYLIICDPSGRHALSLIERGVSPDDICVYEDTDKGYNMCARRGVNVTNDLDELNGMKFDIIIGNPPYGSGGNVAIRFLNKCGDLSDDIRLVLPMSIRKPSSTNKVRLDLRCVDDQTLPPDTFPRGIKAVLQKWIKTDVPRQKIVTLTTHSDFDFVKKENSPDCMIFRCGASAGKIKYVGEFDDNKADHYYIRVNSPKIMTNLETISPLLVEAAKTQNGMPGISKHDLITVYNESFVTDKNS